MLESFPNRELLLKIAGEFYKPENDKLAVDLNAALCHELLIPLSRQYAEQFDLFEINLLQIAGVFSSVYAFQFYPDLLGHEPFWQDPEVYETAKSMGLELRRDDPPKLAPLDEHHLQRYFVGAARAFDNWVCIGRRGAELLFFLPDSYRLRRVWDVFLAVNDSGAEAAYYGTEPENIRRAGEFHRTLGTEVLQRKYLAEAASYMVRISRRWPEVRAEITNGIAEILAGLGCESHPDSVTTFLSKLMTNLASAAYFVALAREVIEKFSPEAILVNTSSAPKENALVHLAINYGLTTYEIVDAATFDGALEYYHTTPEHTPVDYLIGGGGIVKWFRRRGFPDERLVILGPPHYDSVPAKPAAREEIVKADAESGFDLLLILPPNEPYLGGYSISTFVMLQEVLRACEGTNVRIHVKMKFKDNALLLEEIEDLVESGRITLCPTEPYVPEMLSSRHFDGVVSYVSLAVFESVLLGVPALWVDDAFLRPSGALDYAACSVRTNMENLAKDLRRFVTDGDLRWRSLRSGVEYVTETEIFKNHGRCSKTCADFLLDRDYRIWSRERRDLPAVPQLTGTAENELYNFQIFLITRGEEGDRETFLKYLRRYREELLSCAAEVGIADEEYARSNFVGLMDAYLMANMYDEAKKLLGEWTALMPTSELPEIFAYNIASYYELLGDPERSMRAFLELEERCADESRLSALVRYRIAMQTLTAFLGENAPEFPDRLDNKI